MCRYRYPLMFQFRGSAEIIGRIFEMISAIGENRKANRNCSHDGNC